MSVYEEKLHQLFQELFDELRPLPVAIVEELEVEEITDADYPLPV